MQSLFPFSQLLWLHYVRVETISLGSAKNKKQSEKDGTVSNVYSLNGESHFWILRSLFSTSLALSSYYLADAEIISSSLLRLAARYFAIEPGNGRHESSDRERDWSSGWRGLEWINQIRYLLYHFRLQFSHLIQLPSFLLLLHRLVLGLSKSYFMLIIQFLCWLQSLEIWSENWLHLTPPGRVCRVQLDRKEIRKKLHCVLKRDTDNE